MQILLYDFDARTTKSAMKKKRMTCALNFLVWQTKPSDLHVTRFKFWSQTQLSGVSFDLQFTQLAKKVSDSPGLVDFAIGLVNSVLNLPNGQVKFFEEFKLQKTV